MRIPVRIDPATYQAPPDLPPAAPGALPPLREVEITMGEEWDWRRANEEAGQLEATDCRECSGTGRVPFAADEHGARYHDCPSCGGTGKKDEGRRQ